MKHISQIDATVGFPAHVRERLIGEIKNHERTWTPADVDLLIQSVADYWNLKPAQILGESRHRNIVEARMVAISIARVKTRMSLEELGGIFNREHTSLTHSMRALHEHCRKDAKFKAMIENDWPDALKAVDPAEAERWNDNRRTVSAKRHQAMIQRAQEGA